MSSVGESGETTRGRRRLRRLWDVLVGDGRPIMEELMGLHGREGEGEGEAATPLPTEGILLVALRPTGSVGPGDGGPPPASKASIDAMRTVERAVVAEGGADGVEEEECPVCLGGLWVEEEEEEKKKKAGRVGVKEMPCGHRFHGGCIERWLGLHGCCPLCRHRMPEEEIGRGRDVGGETWVAVRFPGRTGGEDDARPEQQQQPMEEAE